MISQIDVMATLAAITKVKLPKNAAPDSYDITPVITSKTYNTPLRKPLSTIRSKIFGV